VVVAVQACSFNHSDIQSLLLESAVYELCDEPENANCSELLSGPRMPTAEDGLPKAVTAVRRLPFQDSYVAVSSQSQPRFGGRGWGFLRPGNMPGGPRPSQQCALIIGGKGSLEPARSGAKVSGEFSAKLTPEPCWRGSTLTDTDGQPA
jgi:hypothetical protein